MKLIIFSGFRQTFVEPIEAFSTDEVLPSSTRINRCYLSTDSGLSQGQSVVFRRALRKYATLLMGSATDVLSPEDSNNILQLGVANHVLMGVFVWVGSDEISSSEKGALCQVLRYLSSDHSVDLIMPVSGANFVVQAAARDFDPLVVHTLIVELRKSCLEVAERLRTSAAGNGNPRPAVKSLVVDLAMWVINLVNRYNHWIGSSELFFRLVIPYFFKRLA